MRSSDIDAWLSELGLEPVDRGEREGVASWDLILDGRRRLDIRLTLILDPAVALVAWVHYAAPLNDTFRVSYRQFLRWNDEIPFAKFAISEDDRPVLTTEVPVELLDRDGLGLAVARLIAICDLLFPESGRWLWPRLKEPPAPNRPSRNEALLDRYAEQLAELMPAPDETADAAPGAAAAAAPDAVAEPATGD